jgi:hypothetical protein
MKMLMGITAVIATVMLATTVLAGTGGSGPLTATAGVLPCTENYQCSESNVCWQGSCQAATCGISATAIGFGNLLPGQSVGDDLSVTSTVTNGGNTPTTDLSLYGTDWVGTYYSASNTMPVGQTSWSVGTGWNILTGSWTSTGANVNPGSPLTAYFKLAVPLNQANDNYAQTITFSASC